MGMTTDIRAALDAAEQHATAEIWDGVVGPPAEGEVAELVEWLRAYSDCEFGPHSEDPDHRGLYRAAELLQQQEAKIERLEQQLETERMRVVACGLIATSDTPFSAAQNRNCDPAYWSASADDIARQIDELMRLRAQQTPVLEETANPWKDVLIDALICAFLLNKENQSDPRQALHDLISWEVQLARDPLINPPVHPTPAPVSDPPQPKDCDEEVQP